MPDKRESFHSMDWIEKARKDLDRVPVRLKEGDNEDAAFHLQQAIEKYLKAFLLSKGWQLKKIHDLEALLDEAVKYEPSFEKFREVCEEITGYYLAGRYPFPAKGPNKREIENAFKRVGDFVKVILESMQD